MTSSFDPEALKKLQLRGKASSVGGQRRKVVPKAGNSGNDQKVQGALKKLGVQAMPGVEEVNMFYENSNVLHFTAPKVHAAQSANTFAVYGRGEEKELTELVPGILNQLGPEAMAGLRRIAEQYQAQQSAAGAAVPGATAGGPDADDADDEVPELVDTEADPKESKLDDVN